MRKSEMLASFLLRVITSGEAGGRNCPKVAKDEGRRRVVLRTELLDLRAGELESVGPLVSGQCAVFDVIIDDDDDDVAVTTVRLPLKLTHSHPWPG